MRLSGNGQPFLMRVGDEWAPAPLDRLRPQWSNALAVASYGRARSMRGAPCRSSFNSTSE